jgi:hypothetical protein
MCYDEIQCTRCGTNNYLGTTVTQPSYFKPLIHSFILQFILRRPIISINSRKQRSLRIVNAVPMITIGMTNGFVVRVGIVGTC